jgi:hypothetical protein
LFCGGGWLADWQRVTLCLAFASFQKSNIAGAFFCTTNEVFTEPNGWVVTSLIEVHLFACLTLFGAD